MGWRLLSMVLVAGLGLELPTKHELYAWSRSAESLLWGRLDDWNTWTPTEDEICLVAETPHPSLSANADTRRTEVASADPSKTPEATADSDFVAVQNEMVAAFAADMLADDDVRESAEALASAPEAVAPEPTKSVAFEPLQVDDDLYSGVAYALNRDAEGAPLAEPAPEPLAAAAEELGPAPEPAGVAAVPAKPLTLEIVGTTTKPADTTPLPASKLAALPTQRFRGRQRLATAFRLTGEALQAWATLLEGPAVVSIHP